ncbi:hypothetical protein SAMN06265360_101236 [Haloechinothrix alba]|uniref:Uncharacterized protein n=1 Tax=Haloechinothrix alba TaxID=664784 RepID=A0A238V2E1_9PSEU|nr:hypothetical protein [Haloechinothrix alba]SNR28600.1 hypothetical protein SAMN06265360_101236 [Haloechinothrix alba]
MPELNDDTSGTEGFDEGRRRFLKRAGFTAAAAAAAAAGGQFINSATAAAQVPGPSGPSLDGMRVVCPCFGDLINLVTSEGTFPFSGAGNVGVLVQGGPDPNKWGLVVEQHEVTAEDTPFGTISIKMAGDIEINPESLLEFDPVNGGFTQTMFLPIIVELEHCGANGDPVTLGTLPDQPVCMKGSQSEFPPKSAPYQSLRDIGLYALGADGQPVGSSPIATLPSFDWTVGTEAVPS